MAGRGLGEGSVLGRRLRELPLAAVLLVIGAGLVLGVLSQWRLGAAVVGAGVLLAAVLRLLLPARRAGLLVVRSRRLDVAVLLVLGAALVSLSSSVPPPLTTP